MNWSQAKTRQTRAQTYCSVVLALGCVFLPSPATASPEGCGSVDRVLTALRLAEAIYPETKSREFDVAVGNGSGPVAGVTDARWVMILVAKDSWRSPGTTDSQSEEDSGQKEHEDLELPFHLRFDFMSGVRGPLCLPDVLNDHPSEKRQKTEQRMLAHPAWSAEEALAAARDAGLRFGPKDRAKLLRTLPLKALSAIYGPLRTQHAEFALMREHEPDAEWSFTELQWEISADVIGTKRILQITVDPFTGRIFSLHAH
jgi:hypothetical protein